MKKRNRKKLNNVGMSLVEIIVVVLIIGILSAGAVLGFSFINSMDASSAAEGIMSTLERTKLNTVSSGESDSIYLELCKDDNHYYCILWNDTEQLDKVEVGGNGIDITVKEDVSGLETSTVISDTVSYNFYYNKSNGSFGSGAHAIIVNGSDTVTIRLVNLTGRCYSE